MRTSIKLALGASILGLAAPASAATFFYNSGNYSPGVTSPSPLLAPDILEMNTGGNKLFNGVNFTNQSGTVNWNGGGLFMLNGATILNQSLWNATADNAILFSGGAATTFTNSGTFRKSGGAGATTISGIGFINTGVIDAQTGSINFQGGTVAFQSGSAFTGAGAVNINNNATFSGAFNSTNLNFNGGTFTGSGSGAVLNGTADWTANTFTGSWTIANGSTLNALTGGNKLINGGTITNNGTLAWQDGGLFLLNGSNLTNNGLIDITAASMSILNSGGAVSTVTNSSTGQFRVNAGTTANVGNRFVNDGGTITSDGTLNFTGGNPIFNAGSVFDGAGSTNINNNATFNGAFSSTNLNFNGGTFTGNGAVLSGTADWTANTFSGGWTIGSGATLNAITGGNKLINGSAFTNNGTLAWQDGGLFLLNGTTLTNNGTIDITGNDAILFSGGAAVNIINNGLIEKSGGGGTTSIGSSLGFDNNGTMNVTSGTIALPSNFANDGVMAGTGSYSVGGVTGLTNNGTIAPGDLGATGTLGLTGNYLQTGTGTLATQLASSSMFDLFNITGSASLNGTLALSCILSCAINTGDSFIILNSNGPLSGTFSNVTTSGFLKGFSYDVIYDYARSEVRLSILDKGMNPIGGVPEPATWAMLILGFGVVGGALRRRAAQRASLVFLN